MISEAEVLAGLAFLEIHAPESMRGAVRMARGACESIRAAEKLAELRLRPADDLELSIRSLNGLATVGVKTVGDAEAFVALSDEEIRARDPKRYLGKKSLREIRALLKNIGLGRRDGRPA